MGNRIHGDEDARGAWLDFAVNVLDIQPPRFVMEAIAAEIPHLAAYPDSRELAAVEAAIAKVHGVSPESVMLCNGAAEGFALLAALVMQNPAIVHPGFSEPEVIFRERGLNVSQVVLDPPFTQLPPLKDCDCVVIGNPANPTGQTFAPELLRAWARERLLVVDEAFLDVVPGGNDLSSMSLVAGGDRCLVVLRSLTKTWSIAGLRVGYVVAHPELIARMRRGRSHWPMGTLQLAAARTIIDNHDQLLPEITSRVEHNRKRMRAMLDAAGWKEASASVAPYVLYKPNVGGLDPEIVRQHLLGQGVAVRRCDTFPGLGTRFWRLAVREPAKVERLLIAVDEAIEHIRRSELA